MDENTEQPQISSEAAKPSQRMIERPTWDMIKSRVTREKEREWMRKGGGPIDVWRADPINEQTPNLPLERIEPVGFIDLHALEPGTLVHFLGYHERAEYIIRAVNINTIKIWRPHAWGQNEVGGLLGPPDAISFIDRSSHNELTDEIDVYKGVLVRRGFRNVKPTIMMPYFNYDQQGKIMKPEERWMDSIKAIGVIRAVAKR
ncbi:hypothetical protein HY404_03415 [Candidatus Microgenomates bacterium]|nr:hypothetical protein [Candidatus Microgenomates bacterium]